MVRGLIMAKIKDLEKRALVDALRKNGWDALPLIPDGKGHLVESGDAICVLIYTDEDYFTKVILRTGVNGYYVERVDFPDDGNDMSNAEKDFVNAEVKEIENWLNREEG